MKIINEKGKLFGLINIVDLLVLIAAVAVAAGVGYKLFAPQIKESVQPQVELTAIVRVRGATPFLVTEVERNSQVGKQLVSGQLLCQRHHRGHEDRGLRAASHHR